MSARAITCPFCGARQSERDPATEKKSQEEKGLAGVELSKDEVSGIALIVRTFIRLRKVARYGGLV